MKPTQKGALNRPAIKQVCQWTKQPWSRARKGIVVKSFKCRNVLDGSEDQTILYMKKTTMTMKWKKKKKVQMTFSGISKISSVL